MKRLIKGITTAMLVAALVFPPVTSAFAGSNPKVPTTPCEQTIAMMTATVNVSNCFPMHMNHSMMNNMNNNMMGMR